ncbi:hypothetical protein C8J56DRAFT_931767 [Mycena floridula]|nr:hypothetical protein C8J56DRAFT_931767 [Mycena floridula]
MFMRKAQKHALGVSNANAPVVSQEWSLIEDDLFEERFELERLLYEEEQLYEDLVLAEHREMLAKQALFHQDDDLLGRLLREYNRARKERVQESQRRLSDRLENAAKMHEKSTQELEQATKRLWQDGRHPPLTSLEVPLRKRPYSVDDHILALQRRIQERKRTVSERIKKQCESSHLEFNDDFVRHSMERLDQMKASLTAQWEEMLERVQNQGLSAPLEDSAIEGTTSGDERN